jgi:hypothetical protein
MGVVKRSEGLEKKVHRPGMKVAGKAKLYGAFLRQQASVFRDQVTLKRDARLIQT